MKGLTRQQYKSLVCLSVLGLTICARDSEAADDSCEREGKQLTATRLPATEHVIWSKQSKLNERDSCKWIIRSSLDGDKVKLSFPIFKLLNATKSDNGDCINIYDADEVDSKHSIDTLCGKVPQQMYTSRNSSISVVFTRGKPEGNRSFSMTYTSDSGAGMLTSLLIQSTSPQPGTSSSRTVTTLFSSTQYKPTPLSTKPQTSPSQIQTSPKSGRSSSSRPQTSSAQSLSAINTEKTVRIVGIVAAALAGMGLTFVILKVTKCCRCLRNKGSTGISHAGSSSGERVRLAHGVQQDAGSGRHVHVNNRSDMTHPLSPPPNNDAVPAAGQMGETTVADAHESDTDSQQDTDEPPPSYESLYLNEQGEPATPPKYSPPVHRSGHPPRRVHTFN